MDHPFSDTVLVGRGEGLTDQAFAVLQAAILDHVLLPGTKLSVPEIARQLNISRSPAREAIARIQHAGLADYVPHRGAVVSRIDLPALVQIYDIREVLEGLAARRAAERGEAGWLGRLESSWSEHSLAVEAGSVEEHVRLDGEFHQRIRDASGNERLADALSGLQAQIRLAMATTSRRGGGARTAVLEHRAILDALRAGDGELAERVARAHIRRLRDSLDQAADEETTR